MAHDPLAKSQPNIYAVIRGTLTMPETRPQHTFTVRYKVIGRSLNTSWLTSLTKTTRTSG